MYTFTFSYGGATVAQTVMSLAGAVPSLWISPVSGMLYADVPNVLFVQVRSTGPFTLQWLVNGMMQQQQTGGNALRLSAGMLAAGTHNVTAVATNGAGSGVATYMLVLSARPQLLCTVAGTSEGSIVPLSSTVQISATLSGAGPSDSVMYRFGFLDDMPLRRFSLSSGFQSLPYLVATAPLLLSQSAMNRIWFFVAARVNDAIDVAMAKCSVKLSDRR